MNKKIASELAVGIILLLAIVIGGIFWMQNKKVQELVMQPAMTTLIDTQLQPVVVTNHAYESWVKDKNSGVEIDGVDLQTFKVVDNSDFAKDKNNVYFPWTIDQQNVKFDAQTFEILSGNYLKDKNQIVVLFMAGGEYELKQLVQADVSTFHPFDESSGGESSTESFGKDNNHIYYDDQIINDADIKTFKFTRSVATEGNIIGQDKNNSYNCSLSDACGAECIITNLKTGKKTTDYFGVSQQRRDPIFCN